MPQMNCLKAFSIKSAKRYRVKDIVILKYIMDIDNSYGLKALHYELLKLLDSLIIFVIKAKLNIV